MPPGGEDEARYFYGDILGMVELKKPEEFAKRGGCWFGSGGVQIHLGLKMISGPRARRIPRYSVATTLR